MLRLSPRTCVFALGALVTSACIATTPSGIKRQTDQSTGGGGSGFDFGGGPPADQPDAGVSDDPHAVTGVDPSHGPFTGGDSVVVHGKGFSSTVRVWFGATELPASAIQPVDPSRVGVVVPAGVAGAADVAVQDGEDASTKRTLTAGYDYDALYATPNSGPVPGGTVVEIVGQSTAWDATTQAFVDDVACTTLDVVSPTLLDCTVPQGTPGSKSIRVVTGKETIAVLDAYTYEDSTNGFKGGLSGMPLAGEVTALVYDNFTGDPIEGGYLIVGDDIATAIVEQTDVNGVAVADDPTLTSPRTMTVAGPCHSPISFVAEPVDTITVYLDPVLTPECAGSGDPPPVGGKPTDTGAITGQLVWPMVNEFKKGNWENVPAAIGPTEKRSAYVFVTSDSATQPFQLPNQSYAVHDDTPGDVGFDFSTYAIPGNHALYALAGIEDDSTSPPKFTAYAMGIARGVQALPSQSTDGVLITMGTTLDHALEMDVTPPSPGPRGPDHLHATLAIQLGNDGYVLLPIGEKDPLLPLQSALDFVGVPNLGDALSGATFSASAMAATGPTNSAPMSVIAQIATNDTSVPLVVDGFPGVPTLTTPATNAAWDGTHLAATFASGGAPIDLTIYDVGSGNGLAHWMVVVPGAANTTTVPDLSALPMSSLIPGPLLVSVYGANVAGFDYTKLTYANLQPQSMTAYSLDVFDAHL